MTAWNELLVMLLFKPPPIVDPAPWTRLFSPPEMFADPGADTITLLLPPPIVELFALL